MQVIHRSARLLSCLCLLVSAPPALAARFPPAIEPRHYTPEVERAIRRVAAASPRKWEPIDVPFRLTTRLHDTRGARVIKTFVIERDGRLFADEDRLDARTFTVGGLVETQLLRQGEYFLEFRPLEEELRRLWPDSLEKDGKADELVFGYVWMPVLVNLYPQRYLRWADAYRCHPNVRVDGKTYHVLQAVPDFELARRHRDLPRSAAYWGLRPEIRYYIDPRTNRIEMIERRLYRWSEANPDVPSYLYRTFVSRVTEWRKVGRYHVPVRIVGQERNPREHAAYKEFEVVLGNITVAPVPAEAFTPLWPTGMRFTEAELRHPDYYRRCLAAPAPVPDEEFLALECAFAYGDDRWADPLHGRLYDRLSQTLAPHDLRAFAAACRASRQQSYVDSAGALLQRALAEAASHRADLAGHDAVAAECRIARLHTAISEHLSRGLPTRSDGSSVDADASWDRTDHAAAAAYLEDCLPRLSTAQARRIILARIVTDYARAGFHHKALSVLEAQGPSCLDDSTAVPSTDPFLTALRQRVAYWKTRADWWQAIIDKMRQRERVTRLRHDRP